MTPTIRIGAAPDLLALVPALAGYRPARSLVCLAFRGPRVIGVLRYDLPSTTAGRDQLAEAALGVLCRIPGIDGMAAIVYTDHRFRGRAAAGERALLRGLLGRAERAGIAARDSLRVACDAWGSLLDDTTPPEGRTLAEIEASPFGGHAAVREAASRAADACAAMPDVPAAETEALRAELARDDVVLPDPVGLIESLLSDPPAAAPAPAEVRRLAALVRHADNPVCRDAMMLQIAFGAGFGELVLDHGVATAEAAAAAGSTVAEYVERMHRCDAEGGVTGPTRSPEPSGGPDPRQGSHVDDPGLRHALSRVLLGETEEQPDPGRVERGLDLLKRAAASATGRPRAGLLCMCAWLAWSIGRGSAAWTLLEAALAADERHGMSLLLARHFARGTLPEWAFHRDSPGQCPTSGPMARAMRDGRRVSRSSTSASPVPSTPRFAPAKRSGSGSQSGER
jgi:hypothetical protein